MYFKLAISNLKKSFKDYSIYFLTLTLAVCIFYSFNSIESQRAILEISSVGKSYTETLIQGIEYMSVFVSCILGGLILYANNFLIKRRNRELGIYMTLGMGKGKISRILIIETVIVGIISLISGIIIGVIASQGLSILVSKLFEVSIEEYKFIFSTAALWKSILYFSIIFFLVMVFNVFVISKYKIIDLLTIGRKTEQIKGRNPIIYGVMFILSLVVLGVAYKFILEVSLDFTDIRFKLSILMGIIGTLMFFVSVGGFLINILKNSDRLYLKGINIFTIKQINSKIKTNFISISVICLMLFITISVLSTGFGFKSVLEKGTEQHTEFDFSGTMYIYGEDNPKYIKESLDKIGFNIGSSEKYRIFNIYNTGVSIGNLLNGVGGEYKVKVTAIKESDYNSIRELRGMKPIDISSDQAIITSNFEKVVPNIKEYLKSKSTINLGGSTYQVYNREVIEDNLRTSYMKDNMLTVVLSDEKVNGLKVYENVINLMYNKGSYEKSENIYRQLSENYKDGKYNFDDSGFLLGNTKNNVIDGNKGSTTIILFIAIYLGVIFLISSMAILSLQQLSEANESADRYVSLKRLGVTRRGINRSILIQTLIYFAAPVILGIIHSVVAIKVVSGFLSVYGKPDIGGASLITMGLFLVIYIGYFLATYTGYKNIIKTKI
ncbi:MAG: FtsX-like permease family protein [Clostridium sp.]